MKGLSSLLLLVITICLIAAACKKPGHSITGGGKGGAATLMVIPEFSNFFIDTFTAYIKYGTLNAPENGIYDDSATCVVVRDTPMVIFTGLKTGIYYFYGLGYHSTGGHPPNLKGSAIATIPTQDSTRIYLPMDPYNL